MHEVVGFSDGLGALDSRRFETILEESSVSSRPGNIPRPCCVLKGFSTLNLSFEYRRRREISFRCIASEIISSGRPFIPATPPRGVVDSGVFFFARARAGYTRAGCGDLLYLSGGRNNFITYSCTGAAAAAVAAAVVAVAEDRCLKRISMLTETKSDFA